MFFIINFLNYLEKHNSNLAYYLYNKIFLFKNEQEFVNYIKQNYKKELEEFLEHKKELEKETKRKKELEHARI